ncbi:MAG: N-acetylmuramoyl-L-alanine amidase [Rhodobacterales bacterium 32-66-7]|nr:MAG: N-acetylmuramoyl-L-alanine amidase [Rhodobacterales bacterium 32-66-7]
MTLTHPSPNFGDRRDGLLPELVVLHYTAMATCAEALARLCDPEAEVSAHYLIDRDGTVLSLVDEDARAWHAGAGSWRGGGDLNSRSIGIELVNSGTEPFAQPQMVALEGLLPGILGRWGIPPVGVIAHSDLAPDRKSDPGPRFDWQRLARLGLSVWPEGALYLPLAPPPQPSPTGGEGGTLPPTVGPATGFLADLRAFGYPDLPLEPLLNAFRLRFRPWASGPLDATDAVLAADLARRFAVDGVPLRA